MPFMCPTRFKQNEKRGKLIPKQTIVISQMKHGSIFTILTGQRKLHPISYNQYIHGVFPNEKLSLLQRHLQNKLSRTISDT